MGSSVFIYFYLLNRLSQPQNIVDEGVFEGQRAVRRSPFFLGFQHHEVEFEISRVEDATHDGDEIIASAGEKHDQYFRVVEELFGCLNEFFVPKPRPRGFLFSCCTTTSSRQYPWVMKPTKLATYNAVALPSPVGEERVGHDILQRIFRPQIPI